MHLRVVMLSLTMLLAWLLVTIILGGGTGFLAQLFSGRSAEVNRSSLNVPVFVPALPTAAAVILAYGRIGYERVERFPTSFKFQYWLTAGLCIIPPSSVGTRRFLVPSVVVVLFGAFFQSWRRSIGVRGASLSALLFLVLAVFPFVRSAGSRTQRTDLAGAMYDYFQGRGLSGILDGYFLSYDTEMFNYVSFLAPRLSSGDIPYGMGRGTIGDLLLAPFPATLAPFPSWSDRLLSTTFGAGCGQGVCPVPSLVGVLIADLALPGLVAGFFALGLFCSRFEESLLNSRGTRLARFLVLGGFAPIIVRGNSVSVTWISFNVFLIVIIALKLGKIDKFCLAREGVDVGPGCALANKGAQVPAWILTDALRADLGSAQAVPDGGLGLR